MVEQNTDNPNNEEVAPKRRGRLFGSRRARSTGQEARGDVDTDTSGVETVASDDDAPVAESTAADETVEQDTAPADGTVQVAVEQVPAAAAEPQDVSTVTGRLPVVEEAGATAPTDDVAAEAAGAPAAAVTARRRVR